MSNHKLPHHHGEYENAEYLKQYLEYIDEFQAVADLFRQLADPSRIRIFWLLCHAEECVMNISSFVDMSSPAVSHHLKQLKVSGLIMSRRSGREVYYKVADTKQARLLHQMIEQVLDINCPEMVQGKQYEANT